MIFKWKNLRIGLKYGIALGLTVVLFAISAGIIYMSLLDIKTNIEKLERRGERAIKVTQMASLFRTKDIRIADYILFKDVKYINEYEQKRAEFRRLQEDIKPKMDTEELKKLYQQISENDEKIHQIFVNNIVLAVKKGDNTEIVSLREKTSQLRAESTDFLEKLRSVVNEERALAVKNAKNSIKKTVKILVMAIIAAGLLGSIFITLISRSINRNLKQIVKINNQVAEGNLAVEKMTYEGKDEIGQLAGAINRMIDNLRDLVNQITVTSQGVTTQSEELTQIANEVKQGSEQIAATMEQMSAGAEEQAGSSNQIASSVDELAHLIKQANQSGEILKETSDNVLNMTGQGTKQMDSSVTQMNTINEIVKDSVEKVKGLEQKSQDISKLVLVINNIAEQTNLLALNAAIEAARAGEAGKGFAVVAEEVRKLAEQVANSITEITAIVKGIQEEAILVMTSLEKGYGEVEEGTNQIQITGQTFQQINWEVSQMAEKIKNISINLEQIADGSKEINTGIEQVASIAQENSAGIEEISASAQQQNSSMEVVAEAANSLVKSAEELSDMINKFRV